MKKLIAIVCLPFVAALLWAQSAKIEGSLTAAASAVMDWSTAAVTRPFALFSSDPGTCTAGKDYYTNNSGTPVLKLCTATNTWANVGGSGGGAFVGSCPTFTTTLSSGGVTMCTISIPANSLAAGAAFTMEGLFLATNNYKVSVFLGATEIMRPVDTNNTWGGYTIYFRNAYQNASGVQNSQTVLPLLSWYNNISYQYSEAPTIFMTEHLTGTYPETPTGVNMANAQTLTVVMSAASAGSGTPTVSR